MYSLLMYMKYLWAIALHIIGGATEVGSSNQLVQMALSMMNHNWERRNYTILFAIYGVRRYP